MSRTRKRLHILGTLLSFVVLLALAPLAAAGGRHEGTDGPHGGLGNPGVYPIDSSPFGKSYAEWSAEHWKWLFSIPFAINPSNDATGADCAQNQSGPVWFLSGSFCPEAQPCSNFTLTRSCTVPSDKAIFFPIVDAECSTLEGNGTTDAELRACAKFFQDDAAGMSCTVDGVPIENLDSYRVQSPLFTYGPLPAGSVLEAFGVPGAVAGATSPSVSDGVFLMLKPLTPGTHTVRFTGSLPDFGFGMDITYTLTVTGTTPAPGAALPAGATPALRATWGKVKTIYR